MHYFLLIKAKTFKRFNLNKKDTIAQSEKQQQPINLFNTNNDDDDYNEKKKEIVVNKQLFHEHQFWAVCAF